MMKNTTTKKNNDSEKQVVINFDGIALVGIWFIVYKMYKLRLSYKTKELEILKNNKITYMPKKED